MSNLSGEERARYVQQMFGQIAGHYDLLNRLMTFGQDKRWRREVIALTELKPGGLLLDLGSGTGDLVREALRQFPSCRTVAADFSQEMMMVGRARHENHGSLDWSVADALNLPFPSNSFDAVVSAFLLRNVGSLSQALQEQFRVLKPGGRLVALDTTPPKNGLLSPAIKFHLHTVIPFLGKLISDDASAYQYLPDSTESFLAPKTLAALLQTTGLKEVGFRQRMFGTVAIHWGIKEWS